MPVIEVVVPACVQLSRKWKAKNYYLNMNNYRNWHYTIQHKTKKEFYKLISKEFESVPKMGYLNQIEYTLIVPTKKKRDRMNVYSVIDKYFCDALQEYKKIEDDSDDFIGDIIIKQSVYMKDKPENIRVLVKITFDC